jgi:hypothetical protein
LKRLAPAPVLPDGDIVAGQVSPVAAQSGFFSDGTLRMAVAFVDVAMAAAEKVGAFLLRSFPVAADDVLAADKNNLGRQGGNDRQDDECAADDG